MRTYAITDYTKFIFYIAVFYIAVNLIKKDKSWIFLKILFSRRL